MNNLKASSSSSFPTAFPANKMHVLLVEHDTQHRDNVKNTLHQYFSCEVTTLSVPCAATALSSLSTEEARFDVMMVDVDSPDINVFHLINSAMKRNVLVVLMTTDEDNAMKTLRALQQRFICIEKPVTVPILECLWQHVFREKAFRLEHMAKAREAMEHNASAHDESGAKDSVKGNENNSRKNNYRMQWTKELHEKFMRIIDELGEGRCYPRVILQRMNEPDLTRMQVASHLQICRNAKWKPIIARPQKPARAKVSPPKIPSQKKPRYGAMPLFATNFQRVGMPENREVGRERELKIGPAMVTCEAHIVISSDQSHDSVTENSIGSQNMEYSVTQNHVAVQQELDLNYSGSFLSLLADDGVGYDEIQTCNDSGSMESG